MIQSPPGATFGGFVDEALVGIAGLVVSDRQKLRHKGLLVGIYVDPANRGGGLARSLVERVIQEARSAGLLTLQLHVSVGNAPAERLYRGLGFQVFGVEERALRVGDRFVDDIMMVLRLD